MVKAPPTSPLEVAKANLLFEVVVVALDAPAQLDDIDELTKSNVGRSVENQYLVGASSPSGHSISSHSSGRLSASQ
ncbi:hypothetical protein ACVWXM_009607 [Bradyrhizobium sp. GM7.3]